MSANNLPDGRFCIAYTNYNVNEPEKVSCFCWAGHGSESLEEAKEGVAKMRQNPRSLCGTYRLKTILLGQVVLQKHSEAEIEDLVEGGNPQGCYGFGKGAICREYLATLLYQNPHLEVVQPLHKWMLDIVSFDQDLRKRGNILSDLYSDWFILKPIARLDIEASVNGKIACFSSIFLAA